MPGFASEPLYVVDESVEADLVELTAGRGLVMVTALEGYIDAGQVGSLFTEHLIAHGERLVTFDADALVDLRSRRPMITFENSTFSQYSDPVIAIDMVLDGQGLPLLVLHGLEPDYHWERFISAVATLIDRFGVSITVNTHGIPVAVPHSRPPVVTISATRPDLVAGDDHWFDRISLPAGVGNLLQMRLGESGHDALGIAVHVPHYLAQMAYYPGAVTLTERLASVADVEIDAGSLREKAQESLGEFANRVESSAELKGLVMALEEQYDAVHKGRNEASLLVEDFGRSADHLAAELEKFLAQQDPEQL